MKKIFKVSEGFCESLTEAIAFRYGENNQIHKWYRNFDFYYLPAEVENPDGTCSYPKGYELDIEETCTVDGQVYQKICCPDGCCRWI